MDMRTWVVIAAVTLAGCGHGSAATGQATTAQVSADKLDVAGVRPGMAAGDVRSTLERAGWRIKSFPAMDWAATVDQEASRQGSNYHFDEPKKGAGSFDAHKGDEDLLITFRPVPAGSVVQNLNYDAPMAGRTSDEVRAQMTKRYGAPTLQSRAGSPVSMTWCTGSERCHGFYGAFKPALLVEEDAYHKLKISMTDGVEADRAWQAGVQKAVGGRVRPQSSF